MITFSELGVKAKTLSGDKINISEIFDKEIIVKDYRVVESNYNKKNEDKMCLHLQIEFEGKTRVLFPGSEVLIDQIEKVPKEAFPFKTTIIKEMNWYKFT